MKAATHFETPNRREILMVQRMRQEQTQAQKEKRALKSDQKVQRQKKRQQFLNRPTMRLASRMGGFLWAVFVSLILTLIACYLAMNPHMFEALTRPVEQFFSVGIAGASPIEGAVYSRANSNKALPKLKGNTVELEAEILVERVLGANYVANYPGREDEIRKLLGETRPYNAKGFSGTLSLVKLELEPNVGLMRNKVDRVREFDQLPTNDVAQLPAEQTFSLRSNKKIGEQRETSLKAAEWRWEAEEFDAFGLPTKYKAFVTYRGEEVWLDYASLKVRAYYAATLSRELPTIVLPLPSLPRPEAPQDSSNAANETGGRQGSRQAVRITTGNSASRQSADPAEEDTQEATSSDIAIQARPTERPASLDAVDSGTQVPPRKSVLPLPLALGLAATTVAAGSAVAVVYYRRRKRQDAEVV